MWANDRKSGFTIVELLIVIVVIGILAAIVIVAFNGVQNRAKDSERSSELASIQKALELYYIDNGGYPTCAGAPGTNLAPFALSANTVAYCLQDDLVPEYIPSLPTDPTDTGSYIYRYAAGYKKIGTTSYTGSAAAPHNCPCDAYILGVRQDAPTGGTYSGWGYTDLTLLLGTTK